MKLLITQISLFAPNILVSALFSNTLSVQEYWVLWTFPSSGILETRKHDVSETGSVSVSN
jgi:hypothetical protein